MERKPSQETQPNCLWRFPHCPARLQSTKARKFCRRMNSKPPRSTKRHSRSRRRICEARLRMRQRSNFAQGPTSIDQVHHCLNDTGHPSGETCKTCVTFLEGVHFQMTLASTKQLVFGSNALCRQPQRNSTSAA